MVSLIDNFEDALPPLEQQRLHTLERVITKGLEGFLKVGSALQEIRNSRLYRATHPTFQAYCRERWALSIKHSNRLISATRVYEHLTTTFPEDAPLLENSNEALFRPLTALSPELQTSIWALIKRIEENPNAPRVQDIVAQVQDAIDEGWQKRGLSIPNNKQKSKNRGQLGTLVNLANKVDSWDPKAIAAADDDEQTLKGHLKASQSLYRFCGEFIKAIENRLSPPNV